MKLEKEVKISEITRCPYYKPRLDDSFKVTLDNDNLSEYEYEQLRAISKSRKIKLTLEVEEPILDEEEREYLSGVIRPFRDEIKSIIKIQILQNDKSVQCIVINFKDRDKMYFKSFERDTMYKGMELNKKYTLEELGL